MNSGRLVVVFCFLFLLTASYLLFPFGFLFTVVWNLRNLRIVPVAVCCLLFAVHFLMSFLQQPPSLGNQYEDDRVHDFDDTQALFAEP
jgi:hypothetical protein